MTMFHHNAGETYEQGAARAAAGFKAKFQSKFDAIFQGAGIDRGRSAFDQVMEQRYKDLLVPSEMLRFSVDENRGLLMRYKSESGIPLTEHAFGQLLQRAGINVPAIFARKLLTSPNAETRALLPAVLQQLNAVQMEGDKQHRYLVRVEDNVARAVLTDNYKRIDSRPQLNAFCESAVRHGLAPIDGCRTELRNHFRVALPQIFEPVPNEPMVIGLEWSNSDVGGGANTIKMFLIRLWCTNTATCEHVLRQVHLGAEISALDFEGVSEKTLALQAETQASAMTDVMNGFLGKGSINAFVDMVARANHSKVDVDKAIGEFYSKSKISKPEANKLREIAQSSDVEILPQMGDTAWRLSNVFSAYAKQVGSTVRAREMEEIAGSVLKTHVPAHARTEDLLSLPRFALPASTDARPIVVGEYEEPIN